MDDYINQYYAYAYHASQMSGLPVDLILAQSALESGYGRSGLASKYNNMFGIKADKSWTGNRINLGTTEYEGGKLVQKDAYFRSYSNPFESFMDWAMFLVRNKRYESAGVFASSDSYEVANALQRAGYATDPEYSSKLSNLINSVRSSTAYTAKTQNTKNLFDSDEVVQQDGWNPMPLRDFWGILKNQFTTEEGRQSIRDGNLSWDMKALGTFFNDVGQGTPDRGIKEGIDKWKDNLEKLTDPSNLITTGIIVGAVIILIITIFMIIKGGNVDVNT